jgi:hypothetical protein
MRDPLLVQYDLNRLHMAGRWLGLAEIAQLPKVLMTDEKIESMIYGIYPAGPAIMLATNRRLLLVDKTPLKLITEDISYSSLSGVECDEGIFFSTVTIFSRFQTFVFKFVNRERARDFSEFLDEILLRIQPGVESAMNEPFIHHPV